MRAVLLSLVLVVASRSADALCVLPHEHPTVLNDGVTAPADGGLVVVTTVDGMPPDEGDALQPRWVFKAGKTTDKPVVTVVAPGLVVYALPKSLTAAALHDGKRSRGKITLAKAQVDALAAPQVIAITHTQRAYGRGNATNVRVKLDSAAPKSALALVAFDDHGLARSFRTVPLGARELDVYSQGRCSALPNGTLESKPGETITVRWVDELGRLSPASKPIKITSVKP